ncbi:MAG: hypothetical protein IT173_17790, partial [Acidobacteria bacterium]|nr:hypothetical protein [Acidobacteriota bacterium]
TMEDTDGDGQMDTADIDGDGVADYTLEAEEGLPTEEEVSTNSVEFTVGEDGFPITEAGETDTGGTYEDASFETPVQFDSAPAADTPVAEPVIDQGYAAPATFDETSTGAADAEAAAQQAHADAAADAQASADEFVAQGDYAAAADARETAENEAYQAGDSSMLGASDSSDLENAAWKQDIAEDYQAQQQEHIAEGDYAAAKEDAQNAGYATGDADYLAGGDDHTGQSDNDVYNLDNAVYDEKNADAAVDNAEWYAAQGDADGVDRNLDQAEAYQASADDFASRADEDSDNYQDDPSSLVETGGEYDAADAGTYDAGAYDAGGYDAGGYDAAADVDTGIDTSVDTSSVSTYDTTTDV